MPQKVVVFFYHDIAEFQQGLCHPKVGMMFSNHNQRVSHLRPSFILAVGCIHIPHRLNLVSFMKDVPALRHVSAVFTHETFNT